MDLPRRKPRVRVCLSLGVRAELGSCSVSAARHFSFSILFLFICTAFLLTGCESESVKVYPVRGKVLFEGQPPAGATVVLRPIPAKAPENVYPRGTVKSDGEFALESYQLGAGAPAGEYVAVLTWFAPDSRELADPPNLLPGRYADETQSGLLVTVKPQPNELPPFQLTR